MADFVYIAPEVLRENGVYTRHADMFGLGLVTWELANQRRAFAEHRSMTVQQYLNEPNAISCEEQLRAQTSPSDGDVTDLNNVISACVAECEKRISSRQFVDRVRAMTSSPVRDVDDVM